MPVIADASVVIRGDLSRFRNDLTGVERQTTTLGQRLNTALSPRALLTGLGVGFGLHQLTDLLGNAISDASSLNETIAKTGEVLGHEALPELEAWAEGAAEAFGASKQEALDAVATFAILGNSADLTSEELVAFSTELTELAGDFASFYDASPEEAITAIGAALRGESEPIRRFGVLLDDATLKQRAFALGLIETTTSALTPQNRVLAAQAEILAQSTEAMGDAERTGDEFAGQQRELTASLKNVSAEIGEKLLPVMIELANFANEVLVPALRAIVDNASAIGSTIGVVTGAFGGNLLGLQGNLRTGAEREIANRAAPSSGGVQPSNLGGTRPINVNINAPTVPMTPRDIGRELRRVSLFGRGL